MTKIVATNLICVIQQSLHAANKAYCKISHGEWVTDRGVESFVAYFLAKAIQKEWPNTIVRLEVTISELERCYLNQKLKGHRSSALNKANRIDLVILNRKETALAVIELKRDQFYGNWDKDVKRIAKFINAYGDLQVACFAAYAAEEALDKSDHKKPTDRPAAAYRLKMRKDQYIDDEWREKCKEYKDIGKKRRLNVALIEPRERTKINERRYEIVGVAFTRKR